LCVFSPIVACAAQLYRRRQWSAAGLRVCELVIFGSVAFQLIPVQVADTSRFAAAGDVGRANATPMFFFLTWVFLILVYGMFIPSTLRRTAAITGAAPRVPFLVAYFQPQPNDHVFRAVALAPVAPGLRMGYGAVLCAVGGPHTVNALRRRGFDALRYGQYRLKRKLGQGGMGQVCLADHALLKRPSAIKLIRPGVDADPAALDRF